MLPWDTPTALSSVLGCRHHQAGACTVPIVPFSTTTKQPKWGEGVSEAEAAVSQHTMTTPRHTFSKASSGMPRTQWRHGAGSPLGPAWVPGGQRMAPTPRESLIPTILRAGPSLLGCRSLHLLGQGYDQLLLHVAHPGCRGAPVTAFWRFWA